MKTKTIKIKKFADIKKVDEKKTKISLAELESELVKIFSEIALKA